MSAVQRMQAGAAPADQPDQVLVFPEPGWVAVYIGSTARAMTHLDLCSIHRSDIRAQQAHTLLQLCCEDA